MKKVQNKLTSKKEKNAECLKITKEHLDEPIGKLFGGLKPKMCSVEGNSHSRLTSKAHFGLELLPQSYQ